MGTEADRTAGAERPERGAAEPEPSSHGEGGGERSASAPEGAPVAGGEAPLETDRAGSPLPERPETGGGDHQRAAPVKPGAESTPPPVARMAEQRPSWMQVEGHVSCAGCGASLDPLRAGHVAIFDAELRFFCNYERCRQRFLGLAPPEPAPPKPPERSPELEAVMPPVRAATASTPDETVPERLEVDDEDALVEPIAAPVQVDAPPEEVPERREMSLLLVALALVAGLLTMALELAEASRLMAMARLVLVGVGACALLGRAVTMERDPAQPHWVVVVIGPVYAGVIACWALLSATAADTARASFLAGTVLTVAALDLWLAGLAAAPVTVGRRWLRERLAAPVRRVAGDAPGNKEIVDEAGSGEQVVVEADETVPVDLEVVDGEADVLPWVGAASTVRRRPGDVVVAGSRVAQGRLRGRCTWSGDDCALARPLLSAARRADAHARLPKALRRVSERWAPLIAIVAGAAAAALGDGALEVALVVVAVYAAFANMATGTLTGLAVARGVRLGLTRGVVYNRPDAWERCSRVTAAVFCARGTLLRGEPELVEVELVSQRGGLDSADELLALAAGALVGQRDPIALAVRRAARDKGIRPDAIRNARARSGGVVAVSSAGDPLVVGTRALLLERRISVAAAEQKMYDLEGSGRTVVLVSLGGRIHGVLALQDGLRSGARAAVQHLLDARIEPILMSADTRETCEALGRALDIDHLRPEVADDERADAIERVRDTGAVVAVLGHPSFDDEALEAADASVALGAAGRERDDFAVSLASDDVRDAALALAISQRTRQQAAIVAAMVLGPAVLGALVVTVGLLPPEYAPLAQLLGAGAALGQLRSFDRR